jgi:hypothetical protein
LNAALVPTPSREAAPPLPAKAVTAAPVTALTVWQASSATKRTFEMGCTARPEGQVNRGPSAAPFVQPEVVDPAKVVTTPAGVTIAMRTSTFIATKTLPLLSTATFWGFESPAAAPVPGM